MARDERPASDNGVDLSTLTYTELYNLVKSDTEVDLRGLQHRWAKKADELQDRANFLHRAAAAMPSHWSGAAGSAFAQHLTAEAKSYDDSARVLYHNSNVLGAAATSLTNAQKRFDELETQGWPKPEGTPDAAPLWRDPKDDPRQPEAYRTVINLSSEYLDHRAQLQDPPGDLPRFEPRETEPPIPRSPEPTDRASHASSGQQPGATTPDNGAVSHDPGPVLAGSPNTATLPTTDVTGTSPNGATTGTAPRAGTGVPLVGQPGNAPNGTTPFGGSRPNQSAAIPGANRTAASASQATSPAGRRGTAPPSGSGGMPPSAAGGPPPKDDRRGRGTDLKEDPEFWTQGIDKGAPPLIGRNHYAASDDDDGFVVPIDVREVQAQVTSNIPVGEHRMRTDEGTFEVRVTRGGA